MTLKEKLLSVPALIGAGISLWIDAPRKVKLVVDHDWEARRAREREAQEARYGKMPRSTLRASRVRRLPPLKCIHMDFWYPYDGKEHKATCRLAIDLEKRRIDPTYTSSWLLGHEHQGSGAIGVALLTLPVTLLLSPFLVATNAVYRSQERRNGMSRHAAAVLEALRGQLDAETEALLTEAFRNTWRHEQAMSSRVTLEQAKALLATCDLHEEYVPKEADIGGTEARGFHWLDDRGEQVADGSFYGSRDHYVRVLGSHFEDADADALIGCHRSRTVRDVSKDD